MTGAEIITMDGLVQKFLALDPERLRVFGGQEPTENDVVMGSVCRIGLNMMLRRALGLYVELAPRENAFIRLETESSARAAGWPDARTANLAWLLTWGLIGEDRMLAGLPRVPVLEPESTLTSIFQQRPPATLESVSELVRKTRTMPVLDVRLLKRGEALWTDPVPVHQAVTSTNALIRDLLGLDPLLLATGVPWYRGKPAQFFEEDAEMKGWAGLNKLARDVMTQYATMKSRSTDEVRLMGEHDARDAGRPDAHSANVATLLSAGLMCENGWEMRFFPARPYSQAREDLLRAMAFEVVQTGSMFAQDGLKMICDDMVHHGVYEAPRKSSRLVNAAYAELKARRKQGPEHQ